MAQRLEGSGQVELRRNALLETLPESELAQLSARVKKVDFRLKETLYELGERIEHVYFPFEGVLSAVREFETGDVVEVATIGPEGCAGHSIVLEVITSGAKVFVQVEGQGVRIAASDLVEILGLCPNVRTLLLRYSNALFHQVAQTAACNRVHTVDARCARWLLMTHDRVAGDSFYLTQEFLSQMLGVQRPTVSTAAAMLMHAGLIAYTRGSIEILDRAGLERSACECYRLVIDHYKASLARD